MRATPLVQLMIGLLLLIWSGPTAAQYWTRLPQDAELQAAADAYVQEWLAAMAGEYTKRSPWLPFCLTWLTLQLNSSVLWQAGKRNSSSPIDRPLPPAAHLPPLVAICGNDHGSLVSGAMSQRNRRPAGSAMYASRR